MGKSEGRLKERLHSAIMAASGGQSPSSPEKYDVHQYTASMPNLGPMEIMVIFLVALLVLGPTRLPETGRQVGRAFTEFRRWSTGFRRELRDVVDGISDPYPPTVDPFDFPGAPSASSPRGANDEAVHVDSKPQPDRAAHDGPDLAPGTPTSPKPSASSTDKPPPEA